MSQRSKGIYRQANSPDYIAIQQIIFKVYDGRAGGNWEKMRQLVAALPQAEESVVRRYYMVLVSTDIPCVGATFIESDEMLYKKVEKFLRALQILAQGQVQLEAEGAQKRKVGS